MKLQRVFPIPVTSGAGVPDIHTLVRRVGVDLAEAARSRIFICADKNYVELGVEDRAFCGLWLDKLRRDTRISIMRWSSSWSSRICCLEGRA